MFYNQNYRRGCFKINTLIWILILIAVIIIGVISAFMSFRYGYAYRKNFAELKIGSAEEEAERILNDAAAAAEKDAENIKKEKLLEAKEEIHKSRSELEREIKERRNELQRQERRVQQKEDTIDKKNQMIEKKEEQVQRRFNEAEELQAEIERVKKLQIAQLEKIATMTASQAKDLLLKEVEDDVKHESALLIKSVEEQAKEEAEEKAKKIITGAIQRCAADHVTRPQFQSFHFPMMK